MTPEQFVVIFVALMGWLFFGMLGALVASQKQAGHTGFLLGLLGPFGFIASFAMDGRKNCPHCNTRLNGKPKVCPGCRTQLDWPAPSRREQIETDDIRFTCPNCSAMLKRTIAESGYNTKCQHCKKNCKVPIPRLPDWEPDPQPVAVSRGGLMSCQDCGGKVSPRASACPHCGGPV